MDIHFSTGSHTCMQSDMSLRLHKVPLFILRGRKPTFFSPKIENGSPTCLGLWNESLTPNSPDYTCLRHLASLNFNNLFYKFSFLSPTQNVSVCLKLSSPALEFLSSSLRLSEFCPPDLPGPLINTPWGILNASETSTVSFAFSFSEKMKLETILKEGKR